MTENIPVVEYGIPTPIPVEDPAPPVEVEEVAGAEDTPVPSGPVAIISEEADGTEVIDEAVAGIGTSVVRTFIPAVVGAVVSVIIGYLASKGWSVEPASVTLYITPIVIAAYYAGVRWLEVNVNPAFGKLLGKASAPAYVK